MPTPFHILLAAFSILLHRYTPDPSLVICTSVSDSPSLPLLLLLDIASEQTFLDILSEVIKKEIDAEKDAVPMDTLLDHIKPEGPLFRVRFFDSTQAAETSHASTSLHTDLTLVLLSTTPAAGSATRAAPIPNQLQLKLSYNSLLFTSSRIQSLLASLTQLLEVASTSPTSTPLGVLPLRTEAQAAVLPDPKADLDWCGFKGAIPDIFSANARAHPDRACVVESIMEEGQNVLDGPSRERKTFTYRQIDEASNVLGHALVKGGLERGEVVMVYAARSVELVVCVMGVLKAGGVFSVIDPAYPPSRQTVYLSVSNPRALLIIASAGTLHPTVSSYISENLSLRMQVPAINLSRSTGAITGSTGEDILTPYQSLSTTPVGVELGPDSHATLSFTSGSTGIPKGVKGRHYSLTHFFPWMSTRFGLSKDEKFTMLSGIAHDPIQRDSKSLTKPG